MIACLGGADLFPSDLDLLRGRILAGVGTLNIGHCLAVLLARCRWCVEGFLAMVRRADDCIVATGGAAIRTMIWVPWPRTWVVLVRHAWCTSGRCHEGECC
jgi:hypothetical protein